MGLQREQAVELECRSGTRQALQVDFIPRQHGGDIVTFIHGSLDLGSEMAKFAGHIHQGLSLALQQSGSELQMVQTITGNLHRLQVYIGLKCGPRRLEIEATARDVETSGKRTDRQRGDKTRQRQCAGSGAEAVRLLGKIGIHLCGKQTTRHVGGEIGIKTSGIVIGMPAGTNPEHLGHP